jgi:general secretion pathway protein D
MSRVNRFVSVVAVLAAGVFGASSTARAQSSEGSPFSIDFAIGWDNDISGNINSSGIGTINNNTNNTNNTVNTGVTGSVQYLSTGVTLDVKPRVNPGGLVYLDISQEVSTPGPIPASGNPQIAQRQIQTQVAVQSGQTLLLGGLIKDFDNSGKTSVPLLSKVPILRDLFGQTTDTRNRVELIVLITPRVINNSDEAQQMTIEYSRQFESLAPLRMREDAANPPPLAPRPAQTQPLPETEKPQEDVPHDH